MNKLTTILAGLLLVASSAFAQGGGQFGGGGGSRLPAPGAAGLCLVSTSATAYAWGACSGSAATAWSALTPSTNSTPGTYAMTSGANIQIGNGSTLTATGTGAITATVAPWAGLTGFPSGCTNQVVTGVGSSLTCTTVTSAYVNNTIALTGVDINTGNQVTITHLAAALPVNQGGTSGTTQTAAFDALSPLTTAGDIIYRNGTNNVRLVAGTANQVLHSGTTPSWSAVDLANDTIGVTALANGGTGTAAGSAAAAFDALAPTTTQGDLILRGASSNARLAIGSNGQCLTSNGTTAAWGSCATGSIGGTGSTNAVAKFTATSTIGDSLLIDTGTTLSYSGGPFSLTGSNPYFRLVEGTAPTGTTGSSWLYADATAHRWKAKNNSNTADTFAMFSDNLSVFAATTSLQLKTLISDETGSAALVFADTPTLVTPVLGVATATSINKVVFTTPATSATLTIADGKTATFPHTITLTSSGELSVITFPNTTATALTDANVVTVPQGGFGTGTHTTHGPLIGEGTSAVASMSAGTANQFIQSGGASADPTWSAYTLPVSVAANQALYATGSTTVTAGVLPVAAGGTSGATAAAAFDALAPTTTQGDLIYRGASSNTRLAAGTVNQVLHSGTTPSWSAVVDADFSGQLTIAKGGTGAATATAAFDALAPTTTQGDLILRGASSNARLALGSNGQCLTSNGTTAVWGSCSTGSITGSSLANTQVVVATSGSTVTSYAGFTSDSSGNVTATSYTSSSAGAGIIYLGQGTVQALGTNSIGFTTPTSVTSYNFVFPAAAASGFLKFSNSSNIVTAVFDAAINLSSCTDCTGTLPPANGGTGLNTIPIHTVLIGNATSAISSTAVGGTGTVLIGQTGADPIWSATAQLGVGGTTDGKLILAYGGVGGANITLQNNAVTSSYNWNFPSGSGTSGQCLQSGGGGTSPMTWGSCGGGGAPAWDTITAPTASNLALSMATHTTTFTYGDQGASATTDLFVITDAASTTTDLSKNLVVDTGGSSRHTPFVARFRGSDALKVCPSVDFATGTAVVGAIIPCATINSVNATPIAKFLVQSATNAHTAARVYHNGAGQTGNTLELYSKTASGTGFNLLVASVSCTDGDTTCAAGTNKFTVRGDGQVTGVNFVSTVATGTAPFTVSSTTNIANLNASSLGGATFAAPGAIGGGTPGSGAFTTLSASSTVSGTGFSTYLASPPAIGGTAPAAGAFTTLTGTSSITLGANGGTGGSVILNGSTSGSATLSVSATGVFALPSGTTATNMVLTTPNIGVATATSVNKMAVTAPATSSTLAVADGKTFTASNTLTLTGTDSSSIAFGAGGTVSYTIASGTSALGTGAISSATCATVVTTSATGTATTDAISWGFNGDPTGVTGYAPATAGMLTIIAYPSTNNVNFKVCNNTTASITPGAITLNWRIVR